MVQKVKLTRKIGNAVRCAHLHPRGHAQIKCNPLNLEKCKTNPDFQTTKQDSLYTLCHQLSYTP